ncbi:hypothetical protein ACWGH4_30535, partial [Streptomyces sp. NPDC054847]
MTGNRCPECDRPRNPDGSAGPGCDCAERAGAALRAEREADIAAAEDFDPLRIRPYVTLEGLGTPHRAPSGPPDPDTAVRPAPAGHGGHAAGGQEGVAHEGFAQGGAVAGLGAAGPPRPMQEPAAAPAGVGGQEYGPDQDGPDGTARPEEDGQGRAAHDGAAAYGGALPPEEVTPEGFSPDGGGARRGGDDTVVLAPVGGGPAGSGHGQGGDAPRRRRRVFAGLAVGAAAVAVAGTAAFAGGLFSGGEEQDRALAPDPSTCAPTASAVADARSAAASASASAS